MNIQTKSADFRRAIVLASKVIERQNTIPILGMVRCRLNGSFEAAGTDLDMQLTATVDRVPGDCADFVLQSPGSVVAALAAAGGDSVSMVPADGTVLLTSGPLSVTVGTLPSDDFPANFERPLNPLFTATLSKDDVAMIARVSDAISTEETRYYLNGLHMRNVGPTTVRIEATDGHRLYFADVEMPNATGSLPENCIIPRKVVRLLIDLAKSSDDGLQISVGTAALANSVDSTAPERQSAPRFNMVMRERGTAITLQTKIIDGTYPDVDRMVPKPGGKQFLFKAADLRRAIAAISGHSKNSRAARISLEPNGTAKITAAYLDAGLSFGVDVPCQHNAPGFAIGYNGRYLASVISSCLGDEILFDVSDPAAPGIVRDPADTAWTAVLMPMRVD